MNALVNITGTVVGGGNQTIKKKDILIISLNWALLTLYVGTDLIKTMEDTLFCFALG